MPTKKDQKIINKINKKPNEKKETVYGYGVAILISIILWTIIIGIICNVLDCNNAYAEPIRAGLIFN